MKKYRVTFSCLIVTAFLMMPSICLGKPKYGGKLIFGVRNPIKQMDPHKGTLALEGQIYTLLGNSLVDTDKNFEPRPALSESWEDSADGKEWTFHLRKGVKFHNGREFTSTDVKWNFDRIMDPKTGSLFRKRWAVLDSITVVDRYTVKLTLKRPSGSVLANFSGGANTLIFIAPECVNADGSVTQPIGTGPFQFIEWKPQEHIKLKRFKEYWVNGLPYLDEINIKPVRDDIVRLNAVQTGDLIMSYFLPVEEVAKLEKKPQKTVHYMSVPIRGFEIIHFNTAKPPFNDIRVRQAVAYGIEKQEIMIGATLGFGKTVNQPFSQESFWYCDVPQTVRDIRKARALLKEAGYPNGLEVTLSAGADEEVAQVIQAQLMEIGMNVKILMTDFPTYITRVIKGKFQLGILGTLPWADPDSFYPTMFDPQGAWSVLTKYKNPQIVQLIKQGAEELDPEKRKEIYTKVVKIYIEEAPAIFTHSYPDAYSWQSYVKGFEPHIAGAFSYSGGGFPYIWFDR